MRIARSPHFLLFHLAESFLLLSLSVSLGLNSPFISLLLRVTVQGRFQSTSLSCLLLSLFSLLRSRCPSHPICYLPAGSVLRCTAVGPSQDPGCMSHPLTICCPKALQAAVASKDPVAVHGHTRMHNYAHSHTRNPFLRKVKLEKLQSALTDIENSL